MSYNDDFLSGIQLINNINSYSESMTFSIVARDPDTKELGIAVQSKFPSVGSLVPWIKLDSGAIATQAMANLKYGTIGLKLLKADAGAENTLRILLKNDPERDHRQVGIVDTKGVAVTYTGTKCYDWAGGAVGDGVACQGNILVSEDTVDAMLDTYLKTKGDLSERLMTALEAGQKAGGDSRGQQSANLLVYKQDGGYDGGSDIYVDVRVDDHPQATSELRRIFELYSLTLLERENPSDITKFDDNINKIGEKLLELNYLNDNNYNKEMVLKAFTRWIHTENFENKERSDGYIWNSILKNLLR